MNRYGLHRTKIYSYVIDDETTALGLDLSKKAWATSNESWLNVHPKLVLKIKRGTWSLEPRKCSNQLSPVSVKGIESVDAACISYCAKSGRYLWSHKDDNWVLWTSNEVWAFPLFWRNNTNGIGLV